MYLLYDQRAGDGDGVYPSTISVQHLECLHVVLPKDGETLPKPFVQSAGAIVGPGQYLIAESSGNGSAIVAFGLNM